MQEDFQSFVSELYRWDVQPVFHWRENIQT